MLGGELLRHSTSAISALAKDVIQVIIITRLHAMYQHSRKMLIFLVVIFLAIQIAGLVIAAVQVAYVSGGKLQSWIKN